MLVYVVSPLLLYYPLYYEAVFFPKGKGIINCHPEKDYFMVIFRFGLPSQGVSEQ